VGVKSKKRRGGRERGKGSLSAPQQPTPEKILRRRKSLKEKGERTTISSSTKSREQKKREEKTA